MIWEYWVPGNTILPRTEFWRKQRLVDLLCLYLIWRLLREGSADHRCEGTTWRERSPWMMLIDQFPPCSEDQPPSSIRLRLQCHCSVLQHAPAPFHQKVSPSDGLNGLRHGHDHAWFAGEMIHVISCLLADCVCVFLLACVVLFSYESFFPKFSMSMICLLVNVGPWHLVCRLSGHCLRVCLSLYCCVRFCLLMSLRLYLCLLFWLFGRLCICICAGLCGFQNVYVCVSGWLPACVIAYVCVLLPVCIVCRWNVCVHIAVSVDCQAFCVSVIMLVRGVVERVLLCMPADVCVSILSACLYVCLYARMSGYLPVCGAMYTRCLHVCPLVCVSVCVCVCVCVCV